VIHFFLKCHVVCNNNYHTQIKVKPQERQNLVQHEIAITADTVGMSGNMDVRSWSPYFPLLFYAFSHCGRGKCSYALSEVSYLYDFEETGTFGVPNQILRDIGTEHFKKNKTGMNVILSGKTMCICI